MDAPAVRIAPERGVDVSGPLTSALIRRALVLGGVAVTILFAAACSGGEDTVDAGRGAPTPGGGRGPLFVSIEVGGGFVPVGHDFRTVPRAVVYADGTSFSPGAITAIYPGPAVLPISVGRLDDDQLANLAIAAGDAGLLGGDPPDVGDPPIADAATTTITVVVDGAAHLTSIYALGTTSTPGGSAIPGITPEQRAARDKIQEFVERVATVVTAAESGLYEPERYRVLPLEPQPIADDVEANELPWPLEDVELRAMSCTAVAGEQAETLRRALDGASEITRWRTAPDQVFTLVARAVLPHEPDCPEPEPSRGNAP